MAMQEDEKFTGKRIFVIGLMASSVVIQNHSLAWIGGAVNVGIIASPAEDDDHEPGLADHGVLLQRLRLVVYFRIGRPMGCNSVTTLRRTALKGFRDHFERSRYFAGTSVRPAP
jgi:hypothetical protein